MLVDCLDRADGARFVWLVSQSAEPLTVTPEVAGGGAPGDLDTDAPSTEAAMALKTLVIVCPAAGWVRRSAGGRWRG
jgi:hypothetical protein